MATAVVSLVGRPDPFRLSLLLQLQDAYGTGVATGRFCTVNVAFQSAKVSQVNYVGSTGGTYHAKRAMRLRRAELSAPVALTL